MSQLPFLLLLLVGSASLLLVYEKRVFSGLGFLPTPKRLGGFAFGFVASSLVAVVGCYFIVLVTGAVLSRNPDFTTAQFLDSSYWMVKSVLMEELLFRGALLYIAIRLFGLHKACFLSSIAFGVYHWFAYSVWGDVFQMIYIFILTGVGGLIFAYAFAYTGSMYLQIGLHLGWNLVSVVVFSQGPMGNQLLIVTGGAPSGTWSILFFIYQVVPLPLITYQYLRHAGYVQRRVVS